MIRPRQLQRLAPQTQDASVAAVAGLAKFSWCAPDQLSPEQIRPSLHHLLVERPLAWRSCHQGAGGLKCFSTTTLDWDTLHLNLPPRTGRSQFPRVLSVEELQRLCTGAKHLRHRVLLMTTSAAGLRVSAGVRLTLPAIESERLLLRVEQGQGRKDRSTLLSARLLIERRADWTLDRPALGWLTGLDPHPPMPRGTAQKISSHAKRTAGITHGQGIQTLRPGFATPRLEAGVAVRTIQLRLGHRSIDTTTRALQIPRQPLATVRRPFDLLPWGDTPLPTPE